MKNIEVIKFLFILFIILSFLAGGYFYTFQEGLENKDGTPDGKENEKESAKESSCPDLLIKSGSNLLLINTKLPRSDTNPLPFYSLDEYIHYVELQKKKGIHCPVLVLQEEVNAQGHQVYRVRSNPYSYEGALPETTNVYNNPETPYKYIDASRESNVYNRNQYPGFDSLGLYIGRYSELDKIHDSTEMDLISDNPMDSNWGGVIHTHNAVASGKYKENEVMPPAKYQSKLFEEKTDNIRQDSKADSIYA